MVAFDLRGQGGSDRMLRDPGKGHVDDFMEYVEDIDAMYAGVVAGLRGPMPRWPTRWERGHDPVHRQGRPAVRPGGARLAAGGAHGSEAPGARLGSAAALDFVALGARYVPGGGARPLSLQPFAGNRLTTDPVRYGRAADILRQHPQLGIGDPTVRWSQAMFSTFRRFADGISAAASRRLL